MLATQSGRRAMQLAKGLDTPDNQCDKVKGSQLGGLHPQESAHGNRKWTLARKQRRSSTLSRRSEPADLGVSSI